MAFRGAGMPPWILVTALVTAAVVAAVAVRFGLSPVLPAFCYLAVAGVPLAFIDARQRRLIGMAVAVAFFLGLLLVSPAGIGPGDVKLAGPLGAYLGWLGAAAFVTGLMAAWLLAAATAIGLLLTRRATRKSEIPFGPFLIAGTLAVVLASGFVPALLGAG